MDTYISFPVCQLSRKPEEEGVYTPSPVAVKMPEGGSQFGMLHSALLQLERERSASVEVFQGHGNNYIAMLVFLL